jgi:hypothetical protein
MDASHAVWTLFIMDCSYYDWSCEPLYFLIVSYDWSCETMYVVVCLIVPVVLHSWIYSCKLQAAMPAEQVKMVDQLQEALSMLTLFSMLCTLIESLR